MRIDENTLHQARTADVLYFFEKYHGFTFAHQGGAYRCQQHKSLAVKNDRLSWYWHSKGIGGYGALDYLVKVENMRFREAVEVIIPFCSADPSPSRPTSQSPNKAKAPSHNAHPSAPQAPNPTPKILKLPEATGVPLKLYNYLCNKRGIDSDIVNTLMQKEQLYEDRRGNVVFVGHDEQGKPRFASIRGTQGDCSFRGDCSGSDKRYGFNIPAVTADPKTAANPATATASATPTEPPRLYIFESAIDSMSHASLENIITGNPEAWKQHHRLSLSGTSDTALPFFLNQHKSVKELVFCLDNDHAGREATVQMARKYAAMGYISRIELPKGKDCNEDLQTLKQQIRAEKRTKYQHQDVTI